MKYRAAGGIFLLLVFLDQITKYLAHGFLKGSSEIAIIKGVFCLQYVENKGVAFGVFQNRQIFIIALTLVLMVVLIRMYWKIPGEQKYVRLKVCCILLGAGAAGNLIDRILYGYVVDFLYFELIQFPVFNVADIYVTVSITLLMILFLFCYGDAEMEVFFK